MRLPDPVCGLELPAAVGEIDEFVRSIVARALELREAPLSP